MKKGYRFNLAKELQRLKRELRKLPLTIRRKIKFVMLFGSQAEGRATPLSDIDIAVYYDGKPLERFNFRIKNLSHLPEHFDMQIYQDLPLYVQKSVLRGKVLYAKDMRFVYDTAYETIKKYDDYKRYLADYLKTRKFEVRS